MAGYSDFFNKNKKKTSKEEQARKANKQGSSWVTPQPEVIKRGRKDKQDNSY